MDGNKYSSLVDGTMKGYFDYMDLVSTQNTILTTVILTPKPFYRGPVLQAMTQLT